MKYDLSNIARRANSYAAAMGKSRAFKKAWAEEKLAIAEAARFELEMKDRWSREDFNRNRELSDNIAVLRKRISDLEEVTAAPTAEAVRKELTWEEQMDALLEAYKDDPFMRSLRRAA